jgi:hypothetical protein
MAQTGAEPGPEAVIGSWRPQSLAPPRPPMLSAHARRGLMALVIVAHVLVLGWLLPLLDPPRNIADQALLVEFITPSAPEPEPAEVIVIPMPKSVPEAAPAKRKRVHPERALQALPSSPAKETSSEAKPGKVEIYGSDGRLKLPPDLLDQIDRKYGDKRVFSYQIPRMDEGAKVWNRPQAVVYEDTRFSQYWKPDQDILTALLTEMVEKTTKEVRMKLPGKSNSTVVCKVSLLALGGGCGVLTPGSDYVGPVDDPNTLSAEEDRQCQAWWEQIVGAQTQDVWRKTRKLYEQSCRKPLERKPAG